MFFDTALRRATWINEKRVSAYPVVFLLAYALIVILWTSGSSLLPDHKDISVSFDFVNVYAAGEAVREGRPAEAYDKTAHQEREWKLERSGQGPKYKEGKLPWFYPPMFLSVAGLTAFLPYVPALVVYSVFGFAVYVFALRKLSPPGALFAIAAFPGAYTNLFIGQNGFLTTALMASGLILLDSSPIAAGAFLGLLSYKPQFFVLIPLVLAAGQYWKALFATIASAAAISTLSLLAFGVETWEGFFASLPYARELILNRPTGDLWANMHTVFSAVRMFGGSVQTGFAIQITIALLTIAFLLRLWMQKSVPLTIKGAALCATFFLSSPYTFNYDEVLFSIPIALLTAEALRTGFLNFEKIFLVALWLLPGIVRDYGDTFGLPLRPPMLAVLLYFCHAHASKYRLALGSQKELTIFLT